MNINEPASLIPIITHEPPRGIVHNILSAISAISPSYPHEISIFSYFKIPIIHGKSNMFPSEISIVPSYISG